MRINFKQIGPQNLDETFLINSFSHFYFLLRSRLEESVGVVNIFEFRFWMDRHVFGWRGRGFITFTKYLSVWDAHFMATRGAKTVDEIA